MKVLYWIIFLMETYSLYFHIPFCRHRCAYCDFNTYAGLEHLIDDYIQALCQELIYISNQNGEKLKVKTIFLGGGTPSLLSPTQLETILETIQQRFELEADPEITIEANPGTVSLEYLVHLRQLGMNRISFGLQSANPSELKLLERGHSYFDLIHSVTWARKAGFDNLNLDLIYGLPNQTMDNWQNSIRLASGLKPEHFSLYALTIEDGTPFGIWAQRGLIPMPDPDLAADMYEWASDYLEARHYRQYEISNWARLSDPLDRESPIAQCKHNVQYWLNLPYLGFGAGAHGFAAGKRTANVKSPSSYIMRMRSAKLTTKRFSFPQSPATQSIEEIDTRTEIGETMMMGLRLTYTGVSRKSFQTRFGFSLEEVFNEQIEHFIQIGLLEWAGNNQDRLRLTKKGRLLGNQVFSEFI